MPLGQVVIDELAAHLAKYPSEEAAVHHRASRPLTYRQWKVVWHDALINTQLSAEELTRMSPAELSAAKKAGRCKPRDYNTHDLRHVTASALISGGASVKQVQTVLAHSTAAITLRVYSHL